MPRKNPMVRINARPSGGRPSQSFVLRIIGGEWRGRKIHFPPVQAIRPTPDRVRETVFNWLQGVTPGSRCLDLYAGSGALGFEALSRGAREVVFVDVEPAVVRHIGDTLRNLGCDRGRTVRADAAGFLAQPATPFDVIFLDPPFAAPVLPDICQHIEASHADLVVLGRHGYGGGLQDWLLGSVSKDVALAAPCDVLMISPGSPAGY